MTQPLYLTCNQSIKHLKNLDNLISSIKMTEQLESEIDTSPERRVRQKLTKFNAELIIQNNINNYVTLDIESCFQSKKQCMHRISLHYKLITCKHIKRIQTSVYKYSDSYLDKLSVALGRTCLIAFRRKIPVFR